MIVTTLLPGQRPEKIKRMLRLWEPGTRDAPVLPQDNLKWDPMKGVITDLVPMRFEEWPEGWRLARERQDQREVQFQGAPLDAFGYKRIPHGDDPNGAQTMGYVTVVGSEQYGWTVTDWGEMCEEPGPDHGHCKGCNSISEVWSGNGDGRCESWPELTHGQMAIGGGGRYEDKHCESYVEVRSTLALWFAD